MEADFLIHAILLTVFLSGTVNGNCKLRYKKWVQNANFGSAGNWNNGRPPCGNDKVVIHEESAAVYFQMNTTIQELILPMSGEIVFGSNAVLAFTTEPDHSATCLSDGKEVEFNLTYPRSWFDPQNWCTTDSETGNCRTESLLDSEKVPCGNENVVFPEGNSYFVDVGSNMNIMINTMKITGKSYSTNTLRSFLSTDQGKRMFLHIPQTETQSTITVQRRTFSDPTGCACGNDVNKILDQICKRQSPHCSKVACLRPIKPSGSCCEICGGVMMLEYGSGFNYDTLRDGLQRNYLDGKDQYKDVKYIVSKMSDGRIQIVLADTSGKDSANAAKAMYSGLLNDIAAGSFKYSVRKVTMESSSSDSSLPTPGAQKSNSSDALPGGEIAGIAVGIGATLILLLVVVFFVCRRNSRSNSDELGFNVFDKISFRKRNFLKPRVEVPPSFGFHFSPSPANVGPSTQGFDNPMYGNNPLENEKPMHLEMMPTSLSNEEQPTFDNSRGFDNPLYDCAPQQESLFSDPTAVEEDKKMDVDKSNSPKSGTEPTVVMSSIIQ